MGQLESLLTMFRLTALDTLTTFQETSYATKIFWDEQLFWLFT